jgi:hypothetical protein
MPRSVSRPVLASEPWVKLVATPASVTPVPTPADGVFAVSVPEGAERWRMLLKLSEYFASAALKAVVFTLAMLLPMTSSPFMKVRSALTPLPIVPMSDMVFVVEFRIRLHRTGPAAERER